MKKILVAFAVAALILPSAVFGANTKTDFSLVNGAEPQSLDPHLIQGVPEHRIYEAIFEGLVVYDNKTAEAKPGIAESWKVEKDGKTYTFKLRKAVWSDGTPITAQTVVDSWLRELDPKTAAPYAYMPAGFIAGGADYNAEKSGPEGVQIKAIDAQTFQATFNGPLPTMSLLAHYSFAIVPVHAIAKFGQDWTKPENFVGNGPYKMETWVPQSKITVVPNTKYWDQKSIKLTKITFLPIEDNNTAYNMFKKGEVDWITTVPLDQLEDAQLRKDYQNDINLGTYYYSLNVTNPTLKDVKVRKALALAIDRVSLVKRVTKGGQLPAYSYSPKFATYTPPTYAAKDDIKAAQKLLADAGFPGGKDFPKMTILYNTSEGHKKIGEYIQDQWKKNLGIEVDLKNEEWKTFLEDRNNHNFEIARAGWLGDYNDPMTFLDMWITTSTNNDAAWSNPKYDELITKAMTMQEGKPRMDVLKQAETILMAELPIIPIYFYTTNNMIDLKKWDGWYGNILDIHSWKNFGPKK